MSEQQPSPSNEHHEEVIPHDLPKPGTGTVIIALVSFAILLTALFFVGWFPHRHQRQLAEADAEATADLVPTVDVVQPKKDIGTKDIRLPADVRANQMTSLYSRANGFLKKLYVDIQDKVTEGQLLAEIDTPEVDAQLAQSKATVEQAKASVTRAEADLKLAQVTLQRYVDAQKNSPGSVTQQDVDQRQAGVDTAASGLVQAKSNVVAAQADVQRLETLQGFEKVFAPFSGTITTRNYDVGALLAPTNTGAGKELFTIAQTDLLKVYVNVPQAYVSNIKTGQPAYLTIRNFGDKEFTGTVARNSGALDPATRTISFELHFPNAEGTLFPGMYGTVRLGLTSPKPTLTVPTSALVFNSNGSQLAVIKEGKAHFQKINIGRDLGTELEVVSGITPEDQIITNPGQRVVDGGEVKIFKKPDQATAEGSKPGDPQASLQK